MNTTSISRAWIGAVSALPVLLLGAADAQARIPDQAAHAPASLRQPSLSALLLGTWEEAPPQGLKGNRLYWWKTEFRSDGTFSLQRKHYCGMPPCVLIVPAPIEGRYDLEMMRADSGALTLTPKAETGIEEKRYHVRIRNDILQVIEDGETRTLRREKGSY
ncbi:hypothetical protein [Streptomyces lavendulae]|uniref:hypothetical protein n=1 Tax=Streptomyces lavendulae TaxID=1914 RepID=UPI00367AD23F